MSDASGRPVSVLVPIELWREITAKLESEAFGEFLPAPEMGPNEMKRLEVIAEKHGQKLFPPNYLD